MNNIYINDMIHVITFYTFTHLQDLYDLKNTLLGICIKNNIKGTILIAEEGFNGTICGKEKDINNGLAALQNILGHFSIKTTYANFVPFLKLKVRIKKEIVRIKCEINIDNVGEYLNADQWDDKIHDPKTIVIDTRNNEEYLIGTFDNAINPNLNTFSEFPAWFNKNYKDLDKNKPIAMFCTGGIRCEKSTAYVKDLGFKHVYHLQGGVIKYLQQRQIDAKPSTWQGDLFVFDDRQALNKNLEPINNG